MSLHAVSSINSSLKQDNCDGIGSSGALLDMLAEVASQKLYNEVTLGKITNKYKSYCNPIVGGRSSRQNKRKINPVKYYEGCDPANKKSLYQPYCPSSSSNKGSLRYCMTANQIRALSAGQLIRLFTVLEGDEIKRTFHFQCQFLPTCQERFFSFGSEEKARHLVKRHLNEHVHELGSDTVVEVPHKYEFLNKRNNYEKNYKKISITKLSNKNNLKQKHKTLSNEEVSELQVEKKNKLETKPVLVNESTDLKNVSQVDNIACTDESTLCPLADRMIDLSAKGIIETITDHNYHRYLKINNTVTSSVMLCDKNDDICRAANNEIQENVDNLNYLNQEGKSDLHSSFNAVIHDQSNPVLLSPDPSGNISEGDLVGKVENVEESFHDLLPVKDATDISVDYITPVGHEVVVTTENYFDETGNNLINSLEDYNIDNNETCQLYQFQEDMTADINVSKYMKCSKISQNVTLKPSLLQQEKKPKGKAKFIGQSAEEREMAVEMIKALKNDKAGGLECQICRPKRVFTAPTTLISHYRSHAGIKPYECLLCKAVFTRQHSLNYHLLIHLNQTRFTCETCGRKFRHPSHFKEHQRRHTGESPFHCPDCTLRFKTRNTYKRHLKTRHGKILMHSGTIISDASVMKTSSKMSKASIVNEELQLSNAEIETTVIDNTIKMPPVMMISNLKENNDGKTISIIGNNELDKENNSNHASMSTSASVVGGINLIKQNHTTNGNNNSSAILLSVIPSLREVQHHSTKTAAVLLLTTGKTSSNKNVIIDNNIDNSKTSPSCFL